MALDCFIKPQEILIDAAGWGDLLLGVVVGAIKPPNPMLMERRISISSFKPPNFANKKYLDEAVKIGEEIIQVMKPSNETCIKVSSEYVLSKLARNLIGRGFNVLITEPDRELRIMVEKGYLRWCMDVGVPFDMLRDKKRFWTLLEWVSERPQLRETLVKTGWASWQNKWRNEIYRSNKL